MAADKKKFIQSAIKRPGRLTSLVGDKPGENIGKVKEVAKTAKSPKDRAAASFFLNTLRPILAKKKKSRSLLS